MNLILKKYCLRYCLKHCLLSILLLGISPTAYSAWYQTTGVAKVYQGNTTQARKKAIDEAIKEALLFSGASISSTQQVRNGLLTQDLFMVRSSGVVNDIEIINEKVSSHQVEVSIRADVFAEDRQCFTADYRKSVAVIPFVVSHQEQAQIGGIYPLASKVSEKIYQRLQSQSLHLDARDYYPSPIQLSGAQQTMSSQLDKAMLAEIARRSDVQYILAGRLTDLSIQYNDNQLINWLTGEQAYRYFDMQIELFNAYNGELVQTFNYQTEAQWPFNTKKRVNINSRHFWQSDYGLAVNNQIDKSLNEIEALMQCTAAKGQIIEVTDNQIRFNLGSKNKINVGDRFKILHQASFTDKQGIVRPNYIISHYQVEVTQVYPHSAVAQTTKSNMLANIQIGDLVSSKLF